MTEALRTTTDYRPRLEGRVSAKSIELTGEPKPATVPTIVRYWDYAPVLPATGSQTILVVHGFRGDHHGLERVVEQLPGHRVIMPDLPGFGQSPRFTDRTHDVPGYCRLLFQLLEALALSPRIVLLGHSFGSIVASQLAAEHPQRISRLILINPIASPALEGPKGVLAKLARFYYWSAAALPEAAGLALLRSPLMVRAMSISMTKTRTKELRRFIHEQHKAYFSEFADRSMLLETFNASISGYVGEVAGRLSMPTLLVAGGTDKIAPPATQRRLLQALPDGRLHLIDGVGHLIHYEAPEPAGRAIKDFLIATDKSRGNHL